MTARTCPGRRSHGWVKVKNPHDRRRGRRLDAAATAAARPARRARVGFHDEGELRYAGKAGTGFTEAELKRLQGCSTPLARETSRSPAPSRRRQTHFVEPTLVASVEYSDITDAGTLRHPVYKGLRDDIDPADAVAAGMTVNCVPVRPIRQNVGMARSMWSGAISFGLVNVPIKLYSAVSKKTVRFHQLNGETGNRIRRSAWTPGTGEEVAYENIVKGYELTKDRYVVDHARTSSTRSTPRSTRTIDIEDFVDLAEIDPVYYDHPYYLVPDKGAGEGLRAAAERDAESGKVAIARVVLRSKEQLVAIRPTATATC